VGGGGGGGFQNYEFRHVKKIINKKPILDLLNSNIKEV
jgi:hypothetical protein